MTRRKREIKNQQKKIKRGERKCKEKQVKKEFKAWR